MTPNAYYAYVAEVGLFKSTNAAKTWQRIGDASGGTMAWERTG